MHVSFFVKDMDKMIDFYVKGLGAKIKMAIRYKSYLNDPDSAFYLDALKTPDDYCIVYLEIAPMQFIELFPAKDEQKKHPAFNEQVGYSHFGIIVRDIFMTRAMLAGNGVRIDMEPNIGNSRTWKMWIRDPEDNRIEIMQYTDESYQIIGHIDE